MKIDLPDMFVQKMKLLLGEEYEQFIASYNEHRYYGLRLNELKIKVSEWGSLPEDTQTYQAQIPWCESAYYYNEDIRPGKHPYYHAGLYYIQEPSAMVPVELLDVQPGHRVLDLCAAPGGKSTQIASKLQQQGTLVSNDIATERLKPLIKNLELAGVRNAVVLNEHPANIAKRFIGWFDRILVDAPCSGEGMFRKQPAMIEEWNSYSVERCSNMQREILEELALMLAPGGRMVYSTCTFSPEENEEQIAQFIAQHPEFSIVPIEPKYGWTSGKPQWVSAETKAMLDEEQLQSIAGTIRLWPHHMKGEGHFVAVLRKQGEPYIPPQQADQELSELRIAWPEPFHNNEHNRYQSKPKAKQAVQKQQSKKPKTTEINLQMLWQQFQQDNVLLTGYEPMRAVLIGDRVFVQPYELPNLDGLKVARAGWMIGEIKNNKFLPYHPLAMGIRPEEATRVLSLSPDSELLLRYLRGETIFVKEEQLQINGELKCNGFVLVCVNRFPVGFGKYMDGMIKNELPAGWRMM